MKFRCKIMRRMPDILVQPVEKAGLDPEQRSFTCPVFWTLNREGPENLALVIQLPGVTSINQNTW